MPFDNCMQLVNFWYKGKLAGRALEGIPEVFTIAVGCGNLP